MNSYQRLTTALKGGEADRVPVFMPLTMHGAKELGLGLKEYFADGISVGEGQLRLWRKFGYDGLFLEFYAVAEAMAFGAEPIFFEDGPPNMGTPPLDGWGRISQLAVPDPLCSPPLRETLRAIQYCAERVKGQVSIVGVALPPFSLPALLLGLESWLELLLFGSEAARNALLRTTGEFCVRWANAQLAAGADAIVLPDAVSSSTIITREQFIAWSLPLLHQAIDHICGPVILASVGRIGPIANLLPQTGALGVLITAEDGLKRCQEATAGKLGLLGNLNNVAMLDWSYDAARRAARACHERAPATGFIMSPQWEVPFGVSDEAIAGIVDAAADWQPRGAAPKNGGQFRC